MQKFIYLFSFLISSSAVVAQQKEMDSLRALSSTEKNKDLKTEQYILIAEQAANYNPDTSFYYAQQATMMAKELNDEKKMIRSEFFMAGYYAKTEKIDSILYFTTKNITRLKDMPDMQKLLVSYLNLEGNYFMRTNRQKDALERFYESLRIADMIGDPLSKIKAGANIGYALMDLNQFDKAITEFRKSIALMQGNDLNIFATVYNNVASCYGSLNQLDSAKKYVSLGIGIAEKNNDLIAEANGLNILGTIWYASNQFEEALQVFLRAKKIREQIGDPFFIVSDMCTIADLYSKTGQPDKGIEIAKQALKIAVENNIRAKFPIIYQTLANNYEAKKDYVSATEIYKKISTLKDSLYADASPQALAEMQTKYETEKKERQIQQQENKITKQNFLIIGSVILFILGALLAITQYRRYKWKQEAKMREEILKQQELSIRAVLEAEEAERQRIAKDLHDGVGQMMSAAKMNLSAYEDETVFKSPEEKLSFEKIISLVDESCKEVRSVSHNMMPNALLKNSLASAIRTFISKLDEKKLKVHLYSEGLDERLDSNIETILYRVIQECVNNVIKHAEADALDISVVKDKEGIRATIEDNGKGFDTNSQTKFEGIGLKNIRTRIEYLKGTVDVDSTPGKGSLVALYVPL